MNSSPDLAGTNVFGIGTDLVEIPRFRLALERRPTLAARLFSDAEREYAGRFKEPAPRLAARFGAKEAVMKALGIGLWKFALRDVEVRRLRSGQPELVLHGRAAAIAAEKGVTDWRLTITHSDFMAMAIAVALTPPTLPDGFEAGR
ncbi:MAG: holo-ACP synthase [Acidimicrobiia bacterium]